jgi:hypothetical protein
MIGTKPHFLHGKRMSPSINAVAVLNGVCVLAIGFAVAFEVQGRLGGRLLETNDPSSYQPPSSNYPFRERPFPYDNASNYRVAWLGPFPEESKQFNLRTGESARLKVERESDRPTMHGCKGVITDSLHVILEGPSIIAPLEVKHEGRSFIATLTAYDVGIYKVYVEMIFKCSNQHAKSYNEIKKIITQPLLLQARKGKRAGFPRKACQDFRWRHGRWMECKRTPLPCVRTGWIWVPDSCHYRIITPDQMINNDPVWIVFAGTSVERGSFLSLVDYVLGERAQNLTTSNFWKCWGWSKSAVFWGKSFKG